MRKNVRKGLKAVLCSMAVLVLSMMSSFTTQAYTPFNHPSAVLAPDGMAWTLVDELPAEDYTKKPASFWEKTWTERTTGQAWDLVADKLGEGEHIYKYDRTGEIPIYKWVCRHETSCCIQNNPLNDNYHGLDSSVTEICGKTYWSGWFPVCANCGDYIINALHYAKGDSLASMDIYNMDLDYYYECPHNGHREMGTKVRVHECDAISANRYMVVYEPNCQTYKGLMDPSFHMYCNATHFEGEEVVPNKYLNKNNYTRSGYTFKGWALTPDGEVVYEDQAEIYNLTDENYADDGTDTGVVYLYAVWERSVSTLIVDANGGVYSDTKGVWDAENTTRTYADVNFGASLALLEENLTPPDGFNVVFDEKGGTPVDDVKTQKEFISWEMSVPFGGRFADDVYRFIGPDGTVDTLTAIYGNGTIILPATTKEGSNFGGWYKNPEYTEFVGFAGDPYTPIGDVILYAKWTDLTLYVQRNRLFDVICC